MDKIILKKLKINYANTRNSRFKFVKPSDEPNPFFFNILKTINQYLIEEENFNKEEKNKQYKLFK